MRRALVLVPLIVLVPAVARATPDDPLWSRQWGLHRIDAAQAWRVERGDGTIVAVIDSGVDGAHPDLRGRLLSGHDFVDDDDDPSDENGHGTLVAGVVAAATGNGVGIAGVAPRAKILPLRVLNADGGGSSSVVADAIRFAVERGADVINLSLAQESGDGGTLLVPPDLLRDPSVDQAIREAAGAGATVVIAAGNDTDGGAAETSYDATVDGVLVVGASTRDDRRAAYSNFGAGLDLIAPGGGSATDPSDAGCTRRNAVISLWWNPEEQESAYGAGCGTSMSVPFVSGVAALLAARGMTNTEAADRILASTKDLGVPGRDDETGSGRLDAAAALGAGALPTTVPSTPPVTRTPATASSVRAQTEPEPRPAVTEHPKRARDSARRDQASREPRRKGTDDRGWPVRTAAFGVAIAVLAHGWRVALRPRVSRRRAR